MNFTASIFTYSELPFLKSLFNLHFLNVSVCSKRRNFDIYFSNSIYIFNDIPDDMSCEINNKILIYLDNLFLMIEMFFKQAFLLRVYLYHEIFYIVLQI